MRTCTGCIVTGAVTPESDFGVLFLHNEGYSTMCRRGIIAIATPARSRREWSLRREPETTIRIDTPAGSVTALAGVEERAGSRRADSTTSAAFVLALDQEVEVPGLGDSLVRPRVRRRILRVRGGGSPWSSRCVPDEVRRLGRDGDGDQAGGRVALGHGAPVRTRSRVPLRNHLRGTGTGEKAPTPGTCACSRRARWTGRRRAPVSRVASRFTMREARSASGEVIEIESIIGTRFTGHVAEVTTFGPHPR